MKPESKRVSVDNAQHMLTADELTDVQVHAHWPALVDRMDDVAREAVHDEAVGGKLPRHERLSAFQRVFLRRYLELAPCDLVIG